MSKFHIRQNRRCRARERQLSAGSELLESLGRRARYWCQVSPELTQGSRHCEEQSDEAIQVLFLDCFALRFAVGSQ
jgi:hypothetical protein